MIHLSDWTKFIISFMLKTTTIIIIINSTIIMVVITINHATVSMVEMATFDRNRSVIIITIITGDRIRKMDGRLQDIKPVVMDMVIMDSSTMDNSTSNVVDIGIK